MPKAPQADPGVNCPLWQKDVSEVCHKCPWYVQLRGVNKNTGADVDDWGCVITFLPMLLIENSAINNRTGAAVESFRNEMVNANRETMQALVLSSARNTNLLRRDS